DDLPFLDGERDVGDADEIAVAHFEMLNAERGDVAHCCILPSPPQLAGEGGVGDADTATLSAPQRTPASPSSILPRKRGRKAATPDSPMPEAACLMRVAVSRAGGRDRPRSPP